MLGREQPQRCLSRWLKIHRIYGPNGLLQENNVSNVLLHLEQGFHILTQNTECY